MGISLGEFKKLLGLAGGATVNNGPVTINYNEAVPSTLTDAGDIASTDLIKLGRGSKNYKFLPDAISKYVLQVQAALAQGGTGSVNRTVQAKMRELPSIEDFGAVGFNTTKDTDGLLKAHRWAVEQGAGFELGYNLYQIAQGVDPMTMPIKIKGKGTRQSILQMQSSMVGTLFELRNVGFGDESVAYPVNGNTPYANVLSDLKSGASLEGFAIYGDRRAQYQTGLLFSGTCDHVSVHDLMIGYVPGRAIWGGAALDGVRGAIRESTFSKIRIRHCGMPDSTASFAIYSEESASNPSADSSNLFTMDDIHIVFPYGRGLEIRDNNAVAASTGVYGITGSNIMLHGRHVRDTRNNGPLLHIEGAVQQIKLDVNVAFNDVGGDVAIKTVAGQSGAIPSDVTIDVNFGDVYTGFELDNGAGIDLNIKRGAFTRREMLTAGYDLQGPVSITCTGDQPFLKIQSDFTLDGANGVEITNMKNFEGKLAFMPAINADGAGDTLQVDMEGLIGTINRSGSIAQGTDKYTFFAAQNGTSTVRAGTYMSKFVVGLMKEEQFSGRYRYSPMDRWGIETKSLKIAPDGAIKFATSLYSGEVRHELVAQSDGNLILYSYDGTGQQKAIFNVYAHFDGGGAAMHMDSPIMMTGRGDSTENAYLMLGDYSLFVDSEGRLRIVGGKPTAELDGIAVGSQADASTDLGNISDTAS